MFEIGYRIIWLFQRIQYKSSELIRWTSVTKKCAPVFYCFRNTLFVLSVYKEFIVMQYIQLSRSNYRSRLTFTKAINFRINNEIASIEYLLKFRWNGLLSATWNRSIYSCLLIFSLLSDFNFWIANLPLNKFKELTVLIAVDIYW